MGTRGKETNFTKIMIFEMCRDIEIKLSQIYTHFSQIFRTDAKACKLWEKTAQEEENHARQCELAVKLLKEGFIGDISADVEEVRAALVMLEEVFDRVVKEPPSLIRALELAIRIEEYFTKFHALSVAWFTDFSLQELFAALMNADRLHVEALKSAYEAECRMAADLGQPSCLYPSQSASLDSLPGKFPV